MTSDRSPPADLDRVDRQLLGLLQADARQTVAQLSEQVALSHSPCWRRVNQLESSGLITGYHARLDRQKLGWEVLGFVHLQLDNHSPNTAAALEHEVMAMDQVLACHNLSGRYDYQLEVVARSLDDFAHFVRERLRRLPGVREIATSFSLGEVKGRRDIPL